MDVVPRVVVGGGGKDGSPATGNVMEALLTMLLSEKIEGSLVANDSPRSAEAEAIRKRIRDGMKGGDTPQS